MRYGRNYWWEPGAGRVYRHGLAGSVGAARTLFAAADVVGLIDGDGPGRNGPKRVFPRAGWHRRHSTLLGCGTDQTFCTAA